MDRKLSASVKIFFYVSTFYKTCIEVKTAVLKHFLLSEARTVKAAQMLRYLCKTKRGNHRIVIFILLQLLVLLNSQSIKNSSDCNSGKEISRQSH